MNAVEIAIGEDGRVQGPIGMRLRIHAEQVEYPLPPVDREARLDDIWRRIDADLDEVVLKPWPENDPIVEKYRRKGLIE